MPYQIMNRTNEIPPISCRCMEDYHGGCESIHIEFDAGHKEKKLREYIDILNDSKRFLSKRYKHIKIIF